MSLEFSEIHLFPVGLLLKNQTSYIWQIQTVIQLWLRIIRCTKSDQNQIYTELW